MHCRRYQFLSLLYYLEFGEWPAPGLGRPGQPSPVVEREWAGGWNAFYNGGSKAGGTGCRSGAQ